MTCNCISRLRGQIKEHIDKATGDNVTAYPTNVAILMTGGSALMIPFTVHGSKKPYTKVAGHQINMQASYCPFCGRRDKQGEGQYDGLPITTKDPS